MKGPAIFDFTSTTYIEAAWYIPFEGGDWMAVLYRDDTATAPWRITCRFKYYVDAQVWESNDRKKVYETTAPDGTEATRLEMRIAMEKTTSAMAAEMGSKRWQVIVRGDTPRFWKLLSRQPWAHTKVVPVAEGPERPQ